MLVSALAQNGVFGFRLTTSVFHGTYGKVRLTSDVETRIAMPITITRISVHDVRFPTSRDRDGSDAMNPDPDYSAAYVVLHTDAPGLEGHGLTFTIGRGNELCVAAVARH